MSSQDQRERPMGERLEDLEVRMAYLEHMLGELDKVVRQTADDLADVRQIVINLQRAAKEGEGESQLRSLEEERPPHY
jgi:uncharacterized coiled-coil protein SlyX